VTDVAFKRSEEFASVPDWDKLHAELAAETWPSVFYGVSCFGDYMLVHFAGDAPTAEALRAAFALHPRVAP